MISAIWLQSVAYIKFMKARHNLVPKVVNAVKD